ncbi:Uncharacterised protein [Achromobacter xylosoxidans]|nr:Uncharacterised protein [Achromobacter xylosoxidans]
MPGLIRIQLRRINELLRVVRGAIRGEGKLSPPGGRRLRRIGRLLRARCRLAGGGRRPRHRIELALVDRVIGRFAVGHAGQRPIRRRRHHVAVRIHHRIALRIALRRRARQVDHSGVRPTAHLQLSIGLLQQPRTLRLQLRHRFIQLAFVDRVRRRLARRQVHDAVGRLAATRRAERARPLVPQQAVIAQALQVLRQRRQRIALRPHPVVDLQHVRVQRRHRRAHVVHRLRLRRDGAIRTYLAHRVGRRAGLAILAHHRAAAQRHGQRLPRLARGRVRRGLRRGIDAPDHRLAFADTLKLGGDALGGPPRLL